MEQMWMIRAGKDAFFIDDFIENNYVGIGWKEIKGDFHGVKTKEDIMERYDRAYPDHKKGKKGITVGQIFRFLSEVKKQDWVITYSPDLRKYHIGVIKSDYRYVDDESIDLRHRRDVEWRYEIERDKLSVSTKNSLGAISTLFAIPETAKNEILSIAKGREPETSTGEDSYQEEEEDFKNIREDMETRAFEFIKDKIQSLDWDEMQELVSNILKAMGYKSRVAPPGPDRGRDVIASPDGLGLEQPRIRGEVKHRAGAIGAPYIRSFIGGLTSNDRGLYVSTGGFTKEAKYEAERSNVPLTLIDINELAMLLIGNYDNLDSDARAMIPLTKVYLPSE